jgi:hypothetical protein
MINLVQRISTYLLVAAPLCLFIAFSSSAAPRHTVVVGYVYFVNSSNETIAYPYSFKTIENSLAGTIWGSVADKPIGGLELKTKKDMIEGREVAFFSGLVKKDNVKAKVAFEYSKYAGEVTYNIVRHLGTYKVNLIVRKKYNNVGQAYRQFKDVLDAKDVTKQELNRTFSDLVALIRSEKRHHLFIDLSLLTKKMLQNQGRILPRHAKILQYIDTLPGFRAFSPTEKFQIYREFGFVISKSKNILAEIETDYNNADMASEMFAQSLDILEGNPNVIARVGIPRVYQQKYDLECRAELYSECFRTIGQFVALHPNFSRRTYKTFIQRYADELRRYSGYGSRKYASESEFIESMSADLYLKKLWRDFLCMASSDDLVAAHVGHYRQLRQVKELASKIAEDQLDQCQVRVADSS